MSAVGTCSQSGGNTSTGSWIRCRIQWLGGKSKYLIPSSLHPVNGTSLMVAKAKAGQHPSDTWKVYLHDHTSERSIQYLPNDKLFVSGLHLGPNTIKPTFQRVEPPPGSAGLAENTPDQWTCLIRFPVLGRLSVPKNVGNAPVAFTKEDGHPTKKDAWRIHVVERGGYRPGVSTSQTVMPWEQALPLKRLRCRIFCEMMGGNMYLAPSNLPSDSHGLTLASSSKSEWSLSPNGGHYSVCPLKTCDTNALELPLSLVQISGPSLPRMKDRFTAIIRQNRPGRPALKPICGFRSKLPRSVGDYTRSIIVLSWSSEAPLWCVEVLGEEDFEPSTYPAPRLDGTSPIGDIKLDEAPPTTTPLDLPKTHPNTPSPKERVLVADVVGISNAACGKEPACTQGETFKPGSVKVEFPKEGSSHKQYPSTPSLLPPNITAETTPCSQSAREQVAEIPKSNHQSMLTPFQEGRHCRIQHVLTGMYLSSQFDNITLTDNAKEPWLLRSAGPGHTVVIPLDAEASTQYLAPNFRLNDDSIMALTSSEYPATWDITHRREVPSVTAGVQFEWICKICWPFTGQFVLADSAPNLHQQKGASRLPRPQVWMASGTLPECNQLGMLRGYWRIQFLV